MSSKPLTIPGGNEKNKPLNEAQQSTLVYWQKRIASSLEGNTSKYPDSDRRLLEGLNAELARRAGGGQPAASAPAASNPQAPQQPSTALATRSTAALATGSFPDAARATEALQRASAVAHLVAPAPVCGNLPEGCELSLSAVLIDVDRETHVLPGGKHGLLKVALDKIAGAAGVTWDPRESRRLDDGSHPHYCHYRAVGSVRGYDGQVMVRTGEVEIDARDGSPLLEEITEKAKNATDRNGNPKPRDPRPQILELRKFLLRHAESKAKNRAIRSLGVRTSYEKAELAKPFAVAKVLFTGRSSDPEARRLFQGKIADAFLGGSGSLYGPPAAQPAALPPARAAYHGPPSVGTVPIGDDDAFDVPGEVVPASLPEASAQAASVAAPPVAEPVTSAPQQAAPAAPPASQSATPPPGAGDAWEGERPEGATP